MNLRFLGQPQSDDDIGYTEGWDTETVRRTNKAPLPDYSADSGNGNKRFGSSHSGGFNTVFADGSVHFIPYTIDPTIFSFLGNKSDGQPISGADY